ncbi:hypothetical protein [Pararhodobacter sp.]|uniref:hypothetical protein n=1 Tax=Pararhodobacter sp. TaxID=2127056 RepID=UPI002AFF9602|nr:hypothetical protein [Pararhodobacter sp.]
MERRLLCHEIWAWRSGSCWFAPPHLPWYFCCPVASGIRDDALAGGSFEVCTCRAVFMTTFTGSRIKMLGEYMEYGADDTGR